MNIIDTLAKEQQKTDVTKFKVGDGVRVHTYGEGVERVFPIHSPRIAKVEVEKQGKARRAKLNYLRDRKGKEATAVRE